MNVQQILAHLHQRRNRLDLAIAERLSVRMWLVLFLCAGSLCSCSRDERVYHPDAWGVCGKHPEEPECYWIRSSYVVLGKTYGAQKTVLFLQHGDALITANCYGRWTTETGEDLPSTLDQGNNCADIPLGSISLEHIPDHSGVLYYFVGNGKHREEYALDTTEEHLKGR
jgi:hypothetical protein